MRLATAGDEILPLRDPRVQTNPAYLTVIVLSRVITRLGTLDMINTKAIEDLFSTDFAICSSSTAASTASRPRSPRRQRPDGGAQPTTARPGSRVPACWTWAVKCLMRLAASAAGWAK